MAGKDSNMSIFISALGLFALVINSDTCAAPQNVSSNSLPTAELVAVNRDTVLSVERFISILFNSRSAFAITEKMM